jgi:hypothetical protein
MWQTMPHQNFLPPFFFFFLGFRVSLRLGLRRQKALFTLKKPICKKNSRLVKKLKTLLRVKKA